MWLEDWDRRNPDGAGGRLAHVSQVRAMKREREQRQEFIEEASEELDELVRLSDYIGLRRLIQSLALAHGDFKAHAPASDLRQLDDMMNRIRRLLDAAE